MSKRKPSEADYSKTKITHTMADGSVRDSVKGYPIPYNETTAPLYHILANSIMRRLKAEAEQEQKQGT